MKTGCCRGVRSIPGCKGGLVHQAAQSPWQRYATDYPLGTGTSKLLAAPVWKQAGKLGSFCAAFTDEGWSAGVAAIYCGLVCGLCLKTMLELLKVRDKADRVVVTQPPCMPTCKLQLRLNVLLPGFLDRGNRSCNHLE